MTEPAAATGDKTTSSPAVAYIARDAATISSHSRVRPWALAAGTAVAVAGATVPLLLDARGAARLAAEPDAHPFLDLLTSCVLAMIAAVALAYPILVGRTRTRPRVVCFFVATAMGAAYLAADELLGFHEALVERYPGSAAVPLTGRVDNGLFALYGIFVLAFLVTFRSVIAGSPVAIALITGAAAGFIPNAADAFGASTFAADGEVGDWVELASSLLLLGAVVTVGLAKLKDDPAPRRLS